MWALSCIMIIAYAKLLSLWDCQGRIKVIDTFLDWKHRYFHQPYGWLISSPNAAMNECPGYLNFSYLIRVCVVERAKLDNQTKPA